MLPSDRDTPPSVEAAAMQDDDGWRRIVWADFLGALALCGLLGGLLAIASSCT
ncbi:hypothetical protein [Phenylobacterium sp.]|jgi:hypothetical protein|uniref:hypothetical protein n=1 Tax=Phenylobacterium sp. TaxID=1871053 RepID=UPI002F931FEA